MLYRSRAMKKRKKNFNVFREFQLIKKVNIHIYIALLDSGSISRDFETSYKISKN